jgi:YD repeat-containing protein
MRVKLRKPINWFGPYQLAEALCFWAKKEKDEFGFPCTPDWVHNFGTWLAGEDKDSWLMKFLSWYNGVRRKYPWNKDVVKIDHYDTWSMDHTLAPIILPMLKQLKATKHGYAMVDDYDVPKHLRSIYALPKDEWEWDGNAEARYEWILDEMIFAFECLVDNSWEEAFYSGEIDHKHVPCGWDAEGKPTLYKMEHGPNHTYKCDYEGMKVVQKRIQNGLCLFGKYFQSLWT